MLNNPLSLTVPSGEFLISALIGAIIGVVVNGINNDLNGQVFFNGWGKAALFGAISGAAAFGIGEIANGITGTFLSTGLGSISNASLFQFVAHGYLGGFMSVAQGGKFGAGFASGAFGSAFGGKMNKWLRNVRDFPKFIDTMIGGGISGGVGSRLAGGEFWDGFRNGAISAGLNHGLHELAQEIRPGKIDFSDDNPKKVLRRTKQWARYVRNNPDADVYLSDMVKHNLPERTFFQRVSGILSANSSLSERTYVYSNGDKIKLGYPKAYIKQGANFRTKIVDVWFKGHIGGNRYDIGFIGNPVNGGNSPTLFYLNIYGESLYNNFKSQILNP